MPEQNKPIPFYQVDAFTDTLFEGNPAGVCPLNEWPSDELLQNIAKENNLSETAFLVKTDTDYALRWFTPAVEVDLCGHATLAAAWVLFNKLAYPGAEIRFATRSGTLTVSRHNDELCMDFPARRIEPIAEPAGLLAALGIQHGVEGIWKSDDIVVVVNDKTIIDRLTPDFNRLALIDTRGVAVTARDDQYDFISRWFGSQVGVNEDPVTGSAHTFLAPLWAERLGKKTLRARQGGKRKGTLRCTVLDNGRVALYGQAVLAIEGRIMR
ncbi:PhzF family phenazine biosynthesis protein [Affinibrenneria salicis]|uniref:PhzF family phenazine biosynthesis protein n=2 Tax=Affinibrenneria salicis TaxID=2590031 RepID=A0A5J5FTC8_9GAMM|nr:PhzF family phenazine biosynthesis protein [Affinibrenneria salicis]